MDLLLAAMLEMSVFTDSAEMTESQQFLQNLLGSAKSSAQNPLLHFSNVNCIFLSANLLTENDSSGGGK